VRPILGLVFAFVSVSAALAQEPLWAYGFLTRPVPGDSAVAGGPPTRKLRKNEDAAAQTRLQHLDGSPAQYSSVDVHDGGMVADWFPGDHPPMPPIIARGSAGLGHNAYACGFCHLPTGQGRPENAPVSGQTAVYFIRQLEDFRHGLRHSADPRKSNPLLMILLAQGMTPEEEKSAADYFAAIPWTPWTRVVETALVPKIRIVNNLSLATETARTQPIGERIVEVPEDEAQAEGQRNARSGFVAYVPMGSLAAGENLVKTGGARVVDGKTIPGRTIACAVCHGPDLMGLTDAPGIAGRSPSYLARQLFDFQQGTRKGAFAALMQPTVANLTARDFIAIAAYVTSLASLPPPAMTTINKP